MFVKSPGHSNRNENPIVEIQNNAQISNLSNDEVIKARDFPALEIRICFRISDFDIGFENICALWS